MRALLESAFTSLVAAQHDASLQRAHSQLAGHLDDDDDDDDADAHLQGDAPPPPRGWL